VAEPRAPLTTPSEGPLLVADALDKVYGSGEGATHALREVTFSFAEGEFGAIIGQFGLGQIHAAQYARLLDTPSAGTVQYRGIDRREGRQGQGAPHCETSSSASSSSSTICCRSSRHRERAHASASQNRWDPTCERGRSRRSASSAWTDSS